MFFQQYTHHIYCSIQTLIIYYINGNSYNILGSIIFFLYKLTQFYQKSMLINVYLDVLVCLGVSWCVLGVSWGIKTDRRLVPLVDK